LDADQATNRIDARISQRGSVPAAASQKLKRPSARSRVPVIGSRGIENVQGQDTASEKDAELLSKMAAWAEETEKGESSESTQEVIEPHATVVNSDGVDEMEVDNEGDYVYDTYVRHLVAADTEMEVVGEGAVGHLIIPEEDQDLWEAYIEDEDGSEKEFDTDEEDSNGSFYRLIAAFTPLISHTDNTSSISGRLLRCRLPRRRSGRRRRVRQGRLRRIPQICLR
jgi:Transcription factor Iwr1